MCEITSLSIRTWTSKKLSMVVAIEPESVNAVTEDPEREEVRLALDSGATETVIPPDILEDVELRQGGPYKRGVEFEVANGARFPIWESASSRVSRLSAA